MKRTKLIPGVKRRLLWSTLILMAGFAGLDARRIQAAAPDLLELSVEDLTRVKVTSVSKHPELLGAAAAAIHVVNQDDIRRQGFTTIADSLRYVPGVQVAQINSHTWGVSARGFNGEYATKLLVMMDGRSVYTPLFAGVYWDAQDSMLEDVDRIEVIRGPGATLWGANAVNGVINITSKAPQDTQGWLVSGGAGTTERGFGGVRYGGKLSDEAYYRFYANYNNRDDSQFLNGTSADDDWQIGRSGFRLDWGTIEADLVTLQGDVYAGKESWSFSQTIAAAPFTENVSADHRIFGANVLGRWTRTLTDGSELKIQSYYDHSERESNLPKETRDTFDLDAQHHFALGNCNDIVWGLGYRLTADAIHNSYASTFTPNNRSASLFSAFAQDEIALVENKLRLTVGSKFEHNDFTGFEYQPSGRLAWTPSDQHTLWVAVSRAIRTPSRAEEDIRINRPAPTPPFPAGSVVSILGDHGGRSEKLVAYELGYRALPHRRLSWEIATFYHHYDELRSLEPGPAPADPPLPVATYYVRNTLQGASWGVELASDWQMLDWWRWRGTYTFFQMDLRLADGGTDLNTAQLLEGNAPAHQFTLRSQMDLPHHLEFDAGLRFVDNLENPHIPAYAALDVRLSWRPRPNLEISVVGLNLIEARHAEFAATQVVTPVREIPRSVYGKISWRF